MNIQTLGYNFNKGQMQTLSNYQSNPNVKLNGPLNKDTVSFKGETPLISSYYKILQKIAAKRLNDAEAKNSFVAFFDEYYKNADKKTIAKAINEELVNWHGETALHTVADENMPETAKYLLEKGADRLKKSGENQRRDYSYLSPIDLAKKSNKSGSHDNMIEILNEYAK